MVSHSNFWYVTTTTLGTCVRWNSNPGRRHAQLQCLPTELMLILQANNAGVRPPFCAHDTVQARAAFVLGDTSGQCSRWQRSRRARLLPRHAAFPHHHRRLATTRSSSPCASPWRAPPLPAPAPTGRGGRRISARPRRHPCSVVVVSSPLLALESR
jgi:hypothetical protein